MLSTCILSPLPQANYVNFHQVARENNWIKAIHYRDDSNEGLFFSGSCYFNFFLNHVYKFYHYEQNLFSTSYENYWQSVVAVAFGICKFHVHADKLTFNFDELIKNPAVFYDSVKKFQKNNNKPVLEYEDFLIRREKFIASCVNSCGIAENFDNLIWVAFVLGQLMIHGVYPEFSIKEIGNQNNCKQFAKENYHKCQLNNFYNFKNTVLLPNL